MSKEMTVVPSSLKLKVYLFALKPDEEFCLKMNFSEGDVGEGGCEGCLQVAWLSACSGVDLERSILVLPTATRGPRSPPLSSFPCHSPVIAIPGAMSSPFHSPSLSIAVLPALPSLSALQAYYCCL